MSNSQKILIFSINNKYFLRENKQKVGYFKPVLRGFELKYHEKTLQIDKKSIGDRILISFENRSYLLHEQKVVSWPEKNEKFYFKDFNAMKLLLNFNKEKISKFISINDFNYVEILKNVPDFFTILFFNLYFLINN